MSRPSYTESQYWMAVNMVGSGATAREIADSLGLSRSVAARIKTRILSGDFYIHGRPDERKEVNTK